MLCRLILAPLKALCRLIVRVGSEPRDFRPVVPRDYGPFFDDEPRINRDVFFRDSDDAEQG